MSVCICVCARVREICPCQPKKQKWMLPSILILNSKKCGQRILWFALYRFLQGIAFSPTMFGTLRQAGITWIYGWRHQKYVGFSDRNFKTKQISIVKENFWYPKQFSFGRSRGFVWDLKFHHIFKTR